MTRDLIRDLLENSNQVMTNLALPEEEPLYILGKSVWDGQIEIYQPGLLLGQLRLSDTVTRMVLSLQFGLLRYPDYPQLCATLGKVFTDIWRIEPDLPISYDEIGGRGSVVKIDIPPDEPDHQIEKYLWKLEVDGVEFSARINTTSLILTLAHHFKDRR